MGLLDYADAAGKRFFGLLSQAPDNAKQMALAAYQLATDPNARQAAMSRQPMAFSDEAAAKNQAMAEGFWNPAGLLGTSIRSKGADFAKTAAAAYKLPSPLYHGSSIPFDKYDFSRLGSMTGAKDAKAGAHLAESFSNADFYAVAAAEKAAKHGKADPDWPQGWVGKFNLDSKSPMVVSEEFFRKSLVNKFLRDKIFAAEFARKHGFDSIVYPHGTNVDAEFTAIALDPSMLKSVD